jgi:lipoprotein-anchoring transpeptidase ErfK/SrfK
MDKSAKFLLSASLLAIISATTQVAFSASYDPARQTNLQLAAHVQSASVVAGNHLSPLPLAPAAVSPGLMPLPEVKQEPGLVPLSIDLRTLQQGRYDSAAPVIVIVDKQKHQTRILQFQDSTFTEVLCVKNSTGKPSTPTPEGRTVVVQKQLDPIWKPPVSIDPKQQVVQPYSKTHRNPLGVANLRLSMDRGMIALHGTNEPKQIGKSVSHGCIRHLNSDILKVEAMVHVGTPVYIVHSFETFKLQPTDIAQLYRPSAERKACCSTEAGPRLQSNSAAAQEMLTKIHSSALPPTKKS